MKEIVGCDDYCDDDIKLRNVYDIKSDGVKDDSKKECSPKYVIHRLPHHIILWSHKLNLRSDQKIFDDVLNLLLQIELKIDVQFFNRNYVNRQRNNLKNYRIFLTILYQSPPLTLLFTLLTSKFWLLVPLNPIWQYKISLEAQKEEEKAK